MTSLSGAKEDIAIDIVLMLQNLLGKRLGDGWVNKVYDFYNKDCCLFPISHRQFFFLSFNYDRNVYVQCWEEVFISKHNQPSAKVVAVSDQKTLTHNIQYFVV